MKTKLLLFLLLWAGVVSGQGIFSITFKKDTLKTVKGANENIIIIPIKINIGDKKNWQGYKVKIEADHLQSSLPTNDYKFSNSTFNFTDLPEENSVNLIIKKDTLEDRDRYLVLNLKTMKDTTDMGKDNIGENKKIVIFVKSLKKKSTDLIDDYKILSYVGTNFDIVEGKTKAKNLFFATNIYLPPVVGKHKVGLYFSLYGNRTMSEVDSTGNVRRTYKIESTSTNSHIRYTSQNKLTVTRVSDNIGVHISPLIKFIKSSDQNLNLYYAPSLEFIWRKSTITSEFTNPSNLDSATVIGTFPGTIIMDNISRKIQNEYVFNAGLVGLFLVYQTNVFSFRVQASTGYSSYFYPSNSVLSENDEESGEVGRRSDIFFLGRAWITEAKTGITLQTEIMNTAINPRPFFGITLSKAFKLDKLGSIFKPLAER